MKYVDRKFSVGKANSKEYVDNWEATFGKKSPEPRCDEVYEKGTEWLDNIGWDDLACSEDCGRHNHQACGEDCPCAKVCPEDE